MERKNGTLTSWRCSSRLQVPETFISNYKDKLKGCEYWVTYVNPWEFWDTAKTVVYQLWPLRREEVLWHRFWLRSSVAEVRFSPVQTPFCPNLNLNLLQNFRTWTEPEPCIRFGFEPSEPCNFWESYFSIFFHVQTLWNTYAISKNQFLCKAVAQTAFDKPNRYHTTDPNKRTCRKATQNMAISHHWGEALILYIKILK